MRRRPTLKDVAQAAGTSVMTASRAINGAGYVSEETRRRVLEAAQMLGYRPNGMARGLVTRRSQAVGVIISDITNPFFPQVIRGIEDALRAQRYHVVLADTDGDPVQDARALGLLLERQVDGLILCASRAPDEELRQVAASGVPVVVINRIVDDPRIAAVLVDARTAALDAVRHLVALGHRRIACITGPRASWSSRERLEGYRQALAEAGLQEDPVLTREATPATMAGGARAMHELLARQPRPTAVFAFDDLIAIGALQAAADHGLHVPRDLAVVGFDDIELAAFIRPALTTVRQPKYQMGREAAELMLQMLGPQPPRGPVRRILPGELVVRESCGGGG